MSDFTKAELFSTASSNKVWLEASGVFTVPALPGAGDTYGIATIPHGFNSDQLIPQVLINGGPTNGVVLPWSSNDGRITQYAYIDSTNLYIVCMSSDSSGSGASSFTINYFYRLLIL